ncbi:Protein mlp1 [Saitoella coloradoensis]
MAQPAETPALNVSGVSAFLEISPETLTSLASRSDDSLNVLLSSIQNKAHEVDALKAEKLRSEVLLEQEMHTAESRVKSMKKQLDAALGENQKLRGAQSSTESSTQSLQTQLQAAASARTKLEEEARSLQSKVQTLESEKRSTLELLGKANKESAQREEDYKGLQERYLEAKRVEVKLDIDLKNMKQEEINYKFKERSLTQELEHLQKSNDWLNEELKKKSSEFSTYRKEKTAQISALENKLENTTADATSAHESLETLKKRHAEISAKLDDSITRNKQLQDRIVQQEENFRNEVEAQQRLAQLWQDTANENKRRIEQLNEQLDSKLSDESEECARLRVEANGERMRADEAEMRNGELEAQLEQRERELATINERIIQGGSDVGASGVGLLSPSAQALSKVQKAGLSVTQLYSQYMTLQSDLDVEKRKNERLQKDMIELISELETRAPQIQQQREEFSRVQIELAQMSETLQEIVDEKENAEREAKQLRAIVQDKETEVKVLEQQTRDLSKQVQHLLNELHDHGAGIPMTPAERAALRRLTEGVEDPAEQSDTEALISQRLTVFRSIQELQQKNQSLLKVVHELGQRMEREEATNRQRLETLESAALEEAGKVIEGLRDELKSAKTKMDSYIRERDMFRRMLVHGGQLDTDAGAAQAPVADRPADEDKTDYPTLLKELQAQFDAYKNESAIDHKTLSDQVSTLTRQKGVVTVDLRKAETELHLAGERYNMLQNALVAAKAEIEMSRKRILQMQETMAKQDVRTQQAADDLVDAKSLADSLRVENQNLKVEKELLKRLEARWTQDNQHLMKENGRLNGLLNNVQTLHAEQERIDAASRRRTAAELEKLEKDLQATKQRLNEESEEVRRLNLRKEFEAKEYQEKIDKLNSDLSTTREAMVEARTSQNHLNARVEELTISLKAAEEKFALTQRSRTTEGGEDVSREQQLDMELSELRASLNAAKAEAAQAKTHMDELKAIANAAEEALQTMNETHDQYKNSTDNQIQQRDTELANMKTQLAELTSELDKNRQELTEIQGSEDAKRAAYEQEIESLKADLERAKEEIEEGAAKQRFHLEDMQKQSDIANEAQQNYERELQKHAEAASNLQKLREQLRDVNNQLRVYRTDAESARASLTSSEASWEAQKEQMENELREMSTRCDDLRKQNDLLHSQFESISSQALKIQQASSAVAADIENAPVSADKSVEELREVIKYLRRERELIDCQHEVAVQENKRIKQELDHTTRALEEVRSQLTLERQRGAESATSAAQHQELIAKIGELNILRESNSALRAENERTGKTLKTLETQVETLNAQLAPLNEQLQTLTAEIEAKDQQIRLIEGDRDHWRSRAQSIFQKYDKIDPAELQALKNNLANLQSQYDALVVEGEAAREAGNAEVKTVRDSWAERYNTMVASSKQRMAELRGQKMEAEKALAEKEQRLQELEKQLADAQTAPAAASGAMEGVETAGAAQLKEQVTKLQAEKEAANKTANNVRARVQTLMTEKMQLTKQVKELQDKLSASASATPAVPPSGEEIDKKVDELVATRLKEAEAAGATPGTADIDAVVAERLAIARAEFEKEKEQAIQDAVKAAQSQPPASDATQIQELSDVIPREEHDKIIAEMTEKHEQDMNNLRTRAKNQATLAINKAIGLKLDKVRAEERQLAEVAKAEAIEAALKTKEEQFKAKEEELTAREKAQKTAELTARMTNMKMTMRIAALEKQVITLGETPSTVGATLALGAATPAPATPGTPAAATVAPAAVAASAQIEAPAAAPTSAAPATATPPAATPATGPAIKVETTPAQQQAVAAATPVSAFATPAPAQIQAQPQAQTAANPATPFQNAMRGGRGGARGARGAGRGGVGVGRGGAAGTPAGTGRGTPAGGAAGAANSPLANRMGAPVAGTALPQQGTPARKGSVPRPSPVRIEGAAAAAAAGAGPNTPGGANRPAVQRPVGAGRGQAQAQGQGQGQGGNMNANAPTFTPGNKRPREEGGGGAQKKPKNQ